MAPSLCQEALLPVSSSWPCPVTWPFAVTVVVVAFDVVDVRSYPWEMRLEAYAPMDLCGAGRLHDARCCFQAVPVASYFRRN